MQKKHFLFASAALALVMSSCSDEIVTGAASADGNVVFTAELPEGVNSRAYSDGAGATVLKYAVYETGTDNIIYSSDDTDAPVAQYGNKNFSLSLPLVKGQTYDLIFWAEAAPAEGKTSPYTFDPAKKTVEVSYTDITGNEESRDAFFTSIEGFEVKGASQESVKLYRPFAQLNIGTNDIAVAEAAGTVLGTVQVTVKDVYNTLNLLTGEATGEEEVVFDYAELPEGETFPVEATPAYDYLSMNYILTGDQILDGDVNQAQKETKDITIAIKDENEKEVNLFNLSAVPFQRNYRTNIYGALLTSNVDYTIEIVPDYNKPGNDHEVKNPEEPTKIDETTYEVSTPAQLIYLSENPSVWKGKTIKLTQDLNMGGYNWKPIGSNSISPDKESMNWFEGTFDGQNHIISNIYCKAAGVFSVAGLFGALRGDVKNVTVQNSYFESNHYAGAVVAYSHNNTAATYGEGKDYPAEGFHITKCRSYDNTIISKPIQNASGTWTDGDKVGGIIGYANSIMTIEDCDSRRNNIQAVRGIGGILGYAGGSKDGSIKITLGYNAAINNNLTQTYYQNYEKTNDEILNRMGEYYGWQDYEPTITGNKPAVHSNVLTVLDLIPENAAQLEKAFRYPADGAVINIAEGTFEEITTNTIFGTKLDGTGKKLTVKGAGIGKTILNINTYYFPKCDIIFEDMTINIAKRGYHGFGNYTRGQFTNVKFNGQLWTWGGEGVTYDNCEFDGTNDGDCYPVWVKLTANATFNNCTVTSNEGRAFLLCGDSDFNAIPKHNVTLNNITVNTNNINEKAKAVFEIHTEADAEGITGTISLNNVTFDETKFSGLWREIDNTGDKPTTTNYRVIVDGTIVQAGI